MSPSNLTAIATILVGFIAPYITEYVGDPAAAQFFIDGAQKTILALAVLVFSWVGSTPYNERVTRIVAAVVRYLEDQRGASSNLNLRNMAIDIIKGEIAASNLGWRGLILKVPVLGDWLLGRMVDGAASGVKLSAAASSGASALKVAKMKNAVAG